MLLAVEEVGRRATQAAAGYFGCEPKHEYLYKIEGFGVRETWVSLCREQRDLLSRDSWPLWVVNRAILTEIDLMDAKIEELGGPKSRMNYRSRYRKVSDGDEELVAKIKRAMALPPPLSTPIKGLFYMLHTV